MNYGKFYGKILRNYNYKIRICAIKNFTTNKSGRKMIAILYQRSFLFDRKKSLLSH